MELPENHPAENLKSSSKQNGVSKMDDVYHHKWGRKFDPSMDPKEIKRIISNRKSSLKARVKMQQLKQELETKLNFLEGQVSRIPPLLSYYNRQQTILKTEIDASKQKIAVLTGEKAFKEAQYEALKEEREKLIQMYLLQQHQKQQQLLPPLGFAGMGPGLDQMIPNAEPTQPERWPDQDIDSINLDEIDFLV